MDEDERLAKQLQEYQELAKKNKDVDLPSLMINAMENQGKNLVSPKQKKWAYLISVALPPLGLLFALKFYLSGKDDGRHVANVCVLFTVISLVLFWVTVKTLFSSAGVNLEQLQQIKPQDIQELVQ